MQVLRCALTYFSKIYAYVVQCLFRAISIECLEDMEFVITQLALNLITHPHLNTDLEKGSIQLKLYMN